jgi:predicted nucleic acid-binding protein
METPVTTGTLLDTTVLIDLSRGNADAADFVDAAIESDTLLAISVVSAMELIAGCRNQAEVGKAEQLIASAKAYDLMLAYSKSHGLTIPDAFIAATAVTQGFELASDNERHFRMIPDLDVRRPY